MLYLAQVHKNDFLDQCQLRLLARQESENFWLTISEETLILLGKGHTISNNLLVLVILETPIPWYGMWQGFRFLEIIGFI